MSPIFRLIFIVSTDFVRRGHKGQRLSGKRAPGLARDPVPMFRESRLLAPIPRTRLRGHPDLKDWLQWQSATRRGHPKPRGDGSNGKAGRGSTEVTRLTTGRKEGTRVSEETLFQCLRAVGTRFLFCGSREGTQTNEEWLQCLLSKSLISINPAASIGSSGKHGVDRHVPDV
jgi:hypothetical protein